MYKYILGEKYNSCFTDDRCTICNEKFSKSYWITYRYRFICNKCINNTTNVKELLDVEYQIKKLELMKENNEIIKNSLKNENHNHFINSGDMLNKYSVIVEDNKKKNLSI
jgi:hypothetical protein